MAETRRLRINVSPDLLEQLAELAQRATPTRTSLIQDEVWMERSMADLADFEVLGWSAPENLIYLRDSAGKCLDLLVERDVESLVAQLSAAGAIAPSLAARLAGPGTGLGRLLAADSATQLTWLSALLTAVFQVAKFSAETAGAPLPDDLANAADALSALAAVLVLVLTARHDSR